MSGPGERDGEVRITGGESVVRSLSANGVEVLFGIPGTHNLPVYDFLSTYGIGHVTTRHEQGAGYAADGYARMAGRPGVVLTTSGPAALNAAAALAQSYSDSVPVLLVAPGMPARKPQAYTGELHEAKDQTGALSSLAQATYRPLSGKEIEVAIALAFSGLSSGRPRPVYLEIPFDVLAESHPVPSAPPAAPEVRPAPPSDESLAAAADLLRRARRPGIVLGGGSREAGDSLRRLAERLGAPVVTTANGKGVVSEDHPLSLGVGLHLEAGRRFLASCDVVLAVGTELAPTDFWEDPPAVGERLIRLDVDPEQMVRGQPADVVLLCRATSGVDGILRHLGATGSPPADAGADEVARLKDECREEAEGIGARWSDYMSAIAEVLPDEAVVVGDTAMACYHGVINCLPLSWQGRYIQPTGFGTLGYALPAAIGAAVASPQRPVVAIGGDGGFQFSLQEMATAASLGRPLPIVIFDNHGYGEIRAEMTARGLKGIGVDLEPPDLVTLAEAYGEKGERTASPSELAAALTAALSRPGVTLLVVEEEEPSR